ncbi:hypothetical protein [Melghirimyces algeriensis]|uniref:hypothetical protein n=1 Tax=Melghirimyces algeriensis TaxID=910412 RepID=UPI00163D817A|nr:hypothetical protein [Melghirimyces algeriensis]
MENDLQLHVKPQVVFTFLERVLFPLYEPQDAGSNYSPQNFGKIGTEYYFFQTV